MRHPTSATTHRAGQTQPLPPLVDVPVLECVTGGELGLVTRDAAVTTRALTGLRVVWTAAENSLDVRRLRDRPKHGPPIATREAVRARQPCARVGARGRRGVSSYERTGAASSRCAATHRRYKHQPMRAVSS